MFLRKPAPKAPTHFFNIFIQNSCNSLPSGVQSQPVTVCLVGERVERRGAEPTLILGTAPTPFKFGSIFWVGDEFVPTFVWMKEPKMWDGGQCNTVSVDPISQ
jgi:hypothetical protein